jgi:ABC-type dipeptide/oligopeptide/nickel transport system permease component
MGLRGFIIKRTIYSFILLLFVLAINFIIFIIMPGNPIEVLAASGRLRPGQSDEIMKLWGLADPLPIRFGKYLVNMLTWNFGYSLNTQTPVAFEMSGRLENTLLLVGTSTVLAIIIGILLGVLAAYKRGGLYDSASVVVSLTTYALPSFWMGMMALLIFSFTLHWFPSAGSVPAVWAQKWPTPLWSGVVLGTQVSIPGLAEIEGRLYHLFLPCMVLTLFSYGGFLLLTRATMLETLSEDYVVTARAKGLSERTVLFKHALKNASLPIITDVALAFGFILTGAIITEQVFTYPGLGQWIFEAISNEDYPVMQAIFYVIALCVIIANFAADLAYGMVDPRIKYK